MKIDTFTSGIVQTDSYILTDFDGTDSAIMIDCPDGNEDAMCYLKENGLVLTHILLTHGHFDHVLGLPHVKAAFPEAEIWMSRDDFYLLENGSKGNIELLESSFPPVAHMYEEDLAAMPQDVHFLEDEILFFKVIRTPGHTPGSVCYWDEKDGILFSGDTVFNHGYGRTDFKGGSAHDMFSSIKRIFSTIPNDTEIYPGHGSETTAREEATYNRI